MDSKIFKYDRSAAMPCQRHSRLLALVLLAGLWLLSGMFAHAQSVRARVVDAVGGQPLVGAWIRMEAQTPQTAVTDNDGWFVIKADTARAARCVISYLGYQTLKTALRQGAVYRLSASATLLRDVVVTATEGKGLTASSRISRHALQHLQPSSFADVLELLPGGMAADPSLTQPNIIALRETGRPSSQYNTSSLGTSFLIDGAPISTNADLQFINGAWDTQATSRDFTNMGVDMRAIATDDVEEIEVVRGIPGVEYGDLTSGLVKVRRRRGGHALQARFKADMESKLLHVAKGLEWGDKRWTLNLSADWLKACADPRNLLEQYQRLSFSVRGGHQWQTERRKWRADLNIDYSGSFDDDDIDPELNYGGQDSYKSDRNRYAASFALNSAALSANDWWRGMDAMMAFSLEKNVLERTRLVQVDHDQPAALTQEEGESQAILIYPYKYTGWHKVDGRPMNAFAKVSADFSAPIPWMKNTLKLGLNWQLDKNFGEGQIFDPYFPLYAGLSTRQRKYSDVPAEIQLAEFLEASVSIPVGRHQFKMDAGLRGTTMMGLASDYDMQGRHYLDPRANAGWQFAPITLGSHPLAVLLRGGWGLHTKMPTVDQLYPERLYVDMVEMNYWHKDRDKQAVWLQTYIVDPTNYALKPARNTKWEVGTDITWHGHRLSLTYFRENMESGFRSMTDYQPYTYKWYDTSGIDHNALTAAPDIALLPYETRQVLRGVSRTENGSQTLKQGWEYTYSSPRWPALATRLTISGAWFKSTYRNSKVTQEHVSRTVAGSNVELVGLYDDDDGYIREMWNTNFTFDTDVERLALGFSASAQCMWYTAQQHLHKEARPTAYITQDGTVHPFTDADALDAQKQFLIRTYNNSMEERQTAPFYMNLNLKATKRLLNNHILVALFVNKLFDLHPDYTRNNYTIRRYVTPYFGLEVNLDL